MSQFTGAWLRDVIYIYENIHIVVFFEISYYIIRTAHYVGFLFVLKNEDMGFGVKCYI